VRLSPPRVLPAGTGEVLRDGHSILRDHIPRETLLGWREAFLPLLHQHIEREGHRRNRGTNRYYVTLPFTAPFADPGVFEDEDILAIVTRLVGEDPVMCQLATDTPLRDSDYQEVHRDAPPLFPELREETPPFQLAINIPLVDVHATNGPLEVVRGTHRIRKDEGMRALAAGEAALEPVTMRLGDVLVRDVRALHRGTPNHTDEPRPMVVLGFSRKWLHRPEVSINVPRGELAKLSPRAQRLLRFNPIVESAEVGEEAYQSFAY
jgi:ectoine hydroxylase-related dioxygenase (phytanoyl-CoA dioxygenase family)